MKAARFSRVGLVLPAIAVGILVWTPAVAAQSAADQYVPKLDRGDAANANAEPVTAPTTTSAESGSTPPATVVQPPPTPPPDDGASGGTSVPGTDYPVTPLVAIIGALLLAALAAKAVIWVANRRPESVRSR